VHQADVGDEAAVKELLRFTVRRLGDLDVLVTSAGTVQDQLLAMMSVKQWDTVLGVNLRGTFLCIREALPFMLRNGSSSIVCLSSIAADKAGRGHANYVAAKGGLNSMVRSLAVELAAEGRAHQCRLTGNHRDEHVGARPPPRGRRDPRPDSAETVR
jgi:3-oxoacyl-[acyl-carrier protein] reductase